MTHRGLRAVAAGLLAFLSLGAAACGQSYSGRKAPTAIHGQLDLTRVCEGPADQQNCPPWSFETDGPVDLSGEWEFYWRQLITPGESSASPQASATMVHVPGLFQDSAGKDENRSGTGFATYRLRLRLPPDAGPLALRLPEQGSAFTLYADSLPIARNGVVAADAENAEGEYRAHSIDLNASGEVTLVMQVSNFQHARGGFWKPIAIGARTQIHAARQTDLGLELFLLGAILVMGLYHLGLYLARPADRTALWFGLFCLIIALRLAVTGETLIQSSIPDAPFELLLTVEYLTFYASVPLFALFLGSLFPAECGGWPQRVIVFLGSTAAAAVTLLPALMFTETLIYFQIFTIVFCLFVAIALAIAIFRRRPNSGTIFVGALILMAAVVFDILVGQFVLQAPFVVPAGLFFFIFAQAAALSRRFAGAFRLAEDLSANLERKVEERTIELRAAREAAEVEQKKSDTLLLNILPRSVADELKEKGHVAPLQYDSVTVLFTDFVGFTRAAETLPPDQLVTELDGCFTYFDEVATRHNLEKLKTIGDAYMCAAGLPERNHTHAIDACLAALEFQAFMNQMKDIKGGIGMPYWELRLGIHSGPVTAGVVGKNKFAYDIWGDTVNTASRCESSGVSGRVNISGDTYRLIADFFECEYRGKVAAKGKGDVDMYFLIGIRPELSRDSAGLAPNESFERKYVELQTRGPAIRSVNG